MSRITVHTIDSAPAKSQARLQAAFKNNGFLPNLLGVLANAPAALEMYQEVGTINTRTSLSAAEREVVQLTAAALNGCGFCVAGHTAVALRKKLLDDAAIQALHHTLPLVDKRLNALSVFTRAVIVQRGNISDGELSDFLAAGFSEQQALEVVLGVSLATLCNFANNLAQTEINPELRPFA